MEILQETKNKISIKIPVETPVISAIRRTIIADVNTPAIDTVDIHKNTTIFPDEYIAQRLGLLVLKSDSPGELNITADDYLVVESGDIAGLEPVEKNIPIVAMKKGQVLHFTAHPRNSTGSEHAKWSPVCPAYVNGDVLMVESTGSLPPRKIVLEGLKTLENKLKNFEIPS